MERGIMSDWREKTIAMIGGPGAAQEGNTLYCHVSYGRIVEELAQRFSKVILCVPLAAQKGPMQDYPLPDNVSFEPMSPGGRAIDGLLGSGAMTEVYRRATQNADAVFVRGVLIGAIKSLYTLAAEKNLPMVHWMVGNPMALLKSHRRAGLIKDSLGKAFVWWWERQLRAGYRRNSARAALLCNGSEIANRFPNSKTKVVVSTTLVGDDFFVREDTCQNDPVTIMSLCFIRPEKGIEYLIEAFAKLKTTRPTRLVLVGGRDRYPGYQAKLDALVKQYNLADRIEFPGHASYEDVPKHLQKADLFVLPTLSEGTPRVLVEARANSAPVVSTMVGGNPDSITDGWDGLLVPSKDPDSLATAMDRMIDDDPFRREAIANGLQRTRELIVPNFVDEIMTLFNQLENSQ